MHTFDAWDQLVRKTVSSRAHARRIYFGPFQSIVTPTAMELAPLTFLVGPNSSGKSAVLDAMQALVASLSVVSRKDYKKFEASCRRGADGMNRIAVGFGATRDWHNFEVYADNLPPRVQPFFDCLFSDAMPRSIDFVVSIAFDESGSISSSESWFRQYVDGEPLLTAYETDLALHLEHPWVKSSRGQEFLHKSELRFYEKSSVSGAASFFSVPGNEFFPLSDLDTSLKLETYDADEYYKCLDIIATIPSLLRATFGVTSLGPWRNVPEQSELRFEFDQPPKDLHYFSGLSWYGGMESWRWIASIFANRSNEPSIDLVNKWLLDPSRFDTGLVIAADVVEILERKVAARPKRPKAVGTRVTLRLRDREGRDLYPADVGSGVSQLVPLVMVTLSSRSLVHIEQPELHLHPSAQAVLGDLFMTRLERADSSMIVETHSELLLLRTLRRLRERAGRMADNPFASSQFADALCYYFDPDRQRNVTAVRKIRISHDGQFLDRWPKGFFSEVDDEIVRLFGIEDADR